MALALSPTSSLPRLHSPRFPLLRRRSHFIKSHRPPNPTPPKPRKLHPLPAPSAPWLESWRRSRLPAPPSRAQSPLDYRPYPSSDDDDLGTSRSTGSTTMSLIIHKLKKFGYIEHPQPPPLATRPEKGSVEDIFHSEDGVLPDARGGLTLDVVEEARFPWEKKGADADAPKAHPPRTRTSLAELTLPEGELRRLRHMAIRMKSKMKVKGAGVTGEIVGAIHERWRTEEVVRIKCEGAPALNMKRTHEILERKTGGLVIWRSGSSLSLYRGVGYEASRSEKKHRLIGDSSYGTGSSGSAVDVNVSVAVEKDPKDDESVPEVKYEHEMDELLEGLGPRYEDWPGDDPLPVDADMLPGTVPGYSPPFRILPYGVRSNLGLKEGTALRRLARVLPPHFALGRSRQHQGLAVAMVKLWERSSIAKIALKRGVQLTSSERMAQDIKRLTGATLLSRNKDFLVFYRGKDFLSTEVAEALLERERLAKTLQDEEEKARLRASSIVATTETIEEPGTTGTLEETLEADARWGHKLDDDHKDRMLRAAEVARHTDIVRRLERKLSLAEYKLMRAAKALAKVEESLKPAERTTDPESITEEERFMFRKLGLKMKAYLLMGRRGVFDGTIENMHLHWKYRELVKVLVNVKAFAQVKNVALSLEAESGGVLVSVDKVSKGFAIIMYRGNDYKRPPTLRPKNLLTKRKALARSIEIQRREAINRHVTSLRRRVDQLRIELEQMENVRDQGDEHLYAKLDSAYQTEDEDIEAEEDVAYLKAFDHATDVDSDEDVEADVQNNDDYEDIEAESYQDQEGDDSDSSIDNLQRSMNFATTGKTEFQSD